MATARKVFVMSDTFQ